MYNVNEMQKNEAGALRTQLHTERSPMIVHTILSTKLAFEYSVELCLFYVDRNIKK